MSLLKRIGRQFYVLGVSILAWVMSFFIRRDENYVAFGSWCGELYNDNSKYLAEYMRIHCKDKKIVWVGNDRIKDIIPEEYIYVKLNSFKSVPVLLKCKYMFFVQMHREDIAAFNVYRKAVLCCLDHGIPIKKWAMDDPNYDGYLEFKNFSLPKKIVSIITGEAKKYDYMTVSSDDVEKMYESAMAYRMNKKSRLIKTGTPRNDFLLKVPEEVQNKIREKIAKEYGYDVNKTVISYLPTYRRCSEKIESFTQRSEEETAQLDRLLEEHNAVLLEKNHFAADQFAVNHQQSHSANVIKIDKPIDFQELLIATDIQIADYSGGYLDYTLLDRPILHYLYDYEEYKTHDSGLYYEADEFAAGRIVDDFQGVMDELEHLLNGEDLYAKDREKIRKRILTYEDGYACRRICEEVFGK